MSGYTKIFSDILQSSIWNEDNKTRILWITMLAMSDKAGFVKAAPTSVALFARLSQEDTRAALNILESPDPESGTEADDGRRIEKIEGGWFIVNYEKYRNRLSTDEEAVKSRERMRKYREKHKGALPDVTLRNPVNAVGDGAGDVNAVEKQGKRFKPPTPEEVEAYGRSIGYKINGRLFVAHYTATGWKRGKTQIPITRWKACVQTWKENDNNQPKKHAPTWGKEGSNQ